MATHWLRNPPSFLTILELEELVVLSIFHDVFYYDDFPHHDARAVELLAPYLKTTIPRDVVAGHLAYAPLADKVRTLQFDSPLEALQQEWVQMDWYLTLVNAEQFSHADKSLCCLPLEFFYHHIGRFLTGDSRVIQTATASASVAS